MAIWTKEEGLQSEQQMGEGDTTQRRQPAGSRVSQSRCSADILRERGTSEIIELLTFYSHVISKENVSR